MRSVSSLLLVGLWQEVIVAQGLPLKVATIILGCIFPLLFSDFRVCGLISISTPPMVVLGEFFHVDAETNPLPVSWYLISSLWMYLCYCMHIMSMLWSITETVSYFSWPNLFKDLTLNVAIYIVFLHFGNFCFSLSSVAEFSDIGARVPTSARPSLFYQRDEFWKSGLSVSHGKPKKCSSPIEIFYSSRGTTGFVQQGPG